MNNHLTSKGIAVFVAGMLFVLVGTLGRRPPVVLLGIVQIGVLMIAYGASVLTNLVMDRRFVSLRISESDSGDVGHGGHVAGDEVAVTLTVTNGSSVPLFDIELEPYTPNGLQVDETPQFERVGAGRSQQRTLAVRGRGSGRWVLQGFDIAAADPLGLVRACDYLDSMFAFEFYPNAGRLRRSGRRRRRSDRRRQRQGRRQVTTEQGGTVIRELREYRSGDPLRHIAWKPTVRQRRLIAREFEEEISVGTTLMLDISGTMRGGRWAGQKLEHGIELCAGLADRLLAESRDVGLVTFDEKVYGFLEPASSRAQYRSILHHLLGLQSVVDPDLTELDDDELESLVADYLLVQERLDFRRGVPRSDASKPVDSGLLRQWIRARLAEERRRYHSPVLREGVLGRDLDPVREFAQLRGLPVPYRSESGVGPKSRGMATALETLVHRVDRRQRIVVISDLCALRNHDILDRGLALARKRGHQVRFVVPFTPAYYRDEEDLDQKREILFELFSATEREQRMESVQFLRDRGLEVTFLAGD